jgi:hypothetical protein
MGTCFVNLFHAVLERLEIDSRKVSEDTQRERLKFELWKLHKENVQIHINQVAELKEYRLRMDSKGWDKAWTDWVIDNQNLRMVS